MPVPETIFLMNQFGEVSVNYIIGGTIAPPLTSDIAAESLYANLTSGAEAPAVVSVSDLVPFLILADFAAGAGTVDDTDSALTAINKLAGNTQNTLVISNVLTGLAAGSNTAIAATDTILEALANLQAQIDAI